MQLMKLPVDFTVCKIQDLSLVDWNQEFVFISKTDEEISLVCETRFVPKNVIVAESDWKAFKIVGILDFSMIGVIAKITNILAQADISVFVVSTYNTDYILLKSLHDEKSMALLIDHGYEVQ